MSARRRGPRVRVRRRRDGLALEIDGTFASLHRPDRPATGSVWDALVAPLLLLREVRRPRVLILGLGGGSASRLVRALAPTAEIRGVEFDPAVVAAARRHFDLDAQGVDVVIGDAREFLAGHRARYDLIIEDLFIGQGRGVYKPEWVLLEGLPRASRRLRKNGILVSNTLDESPSVLRLLRAGFASRLCLELVDYDNRVLAASDRPLGGRALRGALRAEPILRDTLPQLRVRRC